MKFRTAVVGANGFLGINIVKKLLQKGYEVLGIYNNNKENLQHVCEQVNIREFLSKKYKVDNIIFAAGNFENLQKENVVLNCEVLYGMAKMYNESRFVYVSSANVYGCQKGVITENSSFVNPNSYGLSNLTGEFIISSLQNYGIVRPVYLYGPGLNNHSFIPMLINQARNGTIKVVDKGQREQDYLHVFDAAELCIKVMETDKNSIFLGATGKSISNREVAEKICKVFGCKIEFLDKKEKSPSLFFDPSITFEELQWEPRIEFAEGIKDLV